MNIIIDFLKGESGNEIFSGDSLDKRKLSKSFNYIKNFVAHYEIKEKNIFHLKTKPKAKKGQIWLCKQQYYDALGNEIVGNIPNLGLIVSDVDKIANEEFVRIQPVTPITGFAANDDILINDDSVIGFDFIIETWNEQPVLTALLDEFVGNLDVENLKVDESGLDLSKEQKEFRKTEIRNTAYLRQSINSLIEFKELSKGQMVLINIENSVRFPKPSKKETKTMFVNEPELTYLQAAKKGRSDERITYIFEETIGNTEVKVKIIKDDKKYILSVKQPEKVEIKDTRGNLLKQTTQNLYDNLGRGLYFIKVEGIEKEIRVKLK